MIALAVRLPRACVMTGLLVACLATSVAADSATPTCSNGRVFRKCTSPCVVTCDDTMPYRRAECNKLVCGAGSCVCPGDSPIWNERTQTCEPLESCPAYNVAVLVKSDKDSCPVKQCYPRDHPWKCPQGSTLGYPIDSKGCKSCETCIDDTGKPVDVPVCWKASTSCPPSTCPEGMVPNMVTRAGVKGLRPCCHEFDCMAPVDPQAAQREARRKRKEEALARKMAEDASGAAGGDLPVDAGSRTAKASPGSGASVHSQAAGSRGDEL